MNFTILTNIDRISLLINFIYLHIIFTYTLFLPLSFVDMINSFVILWNFMIDFPSFPLNQDKSH